MPYCTNCGGQVKDVYHYCGSCGQALSDLAESEDKSPMGVNREGFLSLRSLSYVDDLLLGEQELDRDSVLYTRLSQEVNAAFADLTRLAMVRDLDLFHLWIAGFHDTEFNSLSEDMSTTQFRDLLAAMGLGRTLQMYDESFHTEFEDEFSDRLQKISEFAEEELDS
ncbi:zinc ribbon domain-containing protein [Halomontanus rarus]|uniref:zinc ribbon domain-containing protein n=1 Tax=Halomontanus rarus TaxID=3034020 RepID=UPI00293BB345|nr:zinc ribbon domain-containing protein [Halovivax sp. KZCA124]